jgi:hypothetical protein
MRDKMAAITKHHSLCPSLLRINDLIAEEQEATNYQQQRRHLET